MNAIVLLTSALVAATPSASTKSDAAAFAASYQLEQAAKYDEAIDALKPVGYKSSYLLELRLGWLYYLSGNYAVSRQHYSSAMRTSPKSLEPRLGLLLPTLALGKYDEAEVTARTILALDSNNYTAGLRLAYALRMQGKYRPARDLLSQLLTLYPTDATLLTEQLLDAAALKQTDVGELCEQLLAVDPTNVSALKYRTTGR